MDTLISIVGIVGVLILLWIGMLVSIILVELRKQYGGDYVDKESNPDH
ncbi:hypothetical protein ACFLXT_04300 [Chloroflexota bacterium]